MTSDSRGARLGSSLVYELDSPILVQALTEAPDSVQLKAIALQNQRVLKAVWLFAEEVSAELSTDHDAMAQEIVRLDHKLDIILAALGQLIGNSTSLPASSRIRLGAASLEWTGDSPLETGVLYRLELYLLPNLPLPLVLVGQLLTSRMDNGRYLHGLEFDLTSENIGALLEKIIFREHRREIARIHRRV